MIEIKLTTSHFSELIKKGYSLDMIFLLKMLIETNEGLSGPKADNLIQTLIRKGLITEKEEVTDTGRELLQFLSSTDVQPKIPRKKRNIAPDDAFDKWWKAYPPTNTFTYKGREFKGDRALRVKKAECKAKIEKILASGEYTIGDLIAALELEVSQKAESSIKSGTNKMSFMQNSLTYLNQCTYESFIDLIKAGYKPMEDTKTAAGGVEI